MIFSPQKNTRTNLDLERLWLEKIPSHQKRLYNHFVTFTVSRSLHGSCTGLAITDHIFCDFTLQHADSEGALLGERRRLQTASSVSTLALGLDEPQAVNQCVKDLSPRRSSQEQLSLADSDTKVGSSPSEGRLELEEAKEEKVQEEEEEGDSYKEDILFGEDQVADFASSVLAAISCWQYKARALLSTHITTVRVSHFLLHSTGLPSLPPLFLPRGSDYFTHKQNLLTPLFTVLAGCVGLNEFCWKCTIWCSNLCMSRRKHVHLWRFSFHQSLLSTFCSSNIDASLVQIMKLACPANGYDNSEAPLFHNCVYLILF